MQTTQETPSELRPEQVRMIQVGTIIALTAFIVLTVHFTMPNRTGWDFRTNLHGPAFMVAEGMSAYDTRITGYPDGVWFPTIVGQFFWLGWLPLDMATVAWTVATAFAFPFALFLIMPRNPSPILLGTLMLLIPIFPPFNYHYALAQVSVYTMLLLILACISLEREKYILVGILFGLASGKPQLILLPVLGFAIALWRMGGWQAWLKVIIAGALTGILSLVPLFIADPNWLTDFFATVDNIPEWQRPSYLDLFVINFGSIGNYMFAVLCTVIIAINTWIWFKLPLRLAFLWCMTLNLVAIPLVWSWDFVMLLPLYVYYLLDLKSVVARILLIILFSVCIIASIGVNTFLGEAYYHWWIPTFMILSILIAIGVERYFSPKPETHSEARNEQSTLVRNLLSKSN